MVAMTIATEVEVPEVPVIRVGDKLFCYMDGEGHFEAVVVLKINSDSTYTVRYTGGCVIRVVGSRLHTADKAKKLFSEWLESAFG